MTASRAWCKRASNMRRTLLADPSAVRSVVQRALGELREQLSNELIHRRWKITQTDVLQTRELVLACYGFHSRPFLGLISP